jgi:acetolactate synthase-1/2/3 large subunit
VGTAEAAAAIAGAVRSAGGGPLFGVPGGGGNLDLVGAVESAGLAFLLCHGETAAAIAAATWGEETGRPAICVATRGPGAASLVNGLAHALLDRAPLIAVTDGIPLDQRERTPHQRLDHARLLGEVVKASAPIDADPSVATAAVALAMAPPAGPVHLDVVPGSLPVPLPLPPPAPPEPAALAEVRDLIARSRRPVVIAGVGARGHAGALAALVAGSATPVLSTYKAKGLAPEPNDAGLCTGGTLEQAVLDEADLVIGFGLDPVELIPGSWPVAAPLVSLAAWPTTDPRYPVSVEVVGDLGELADLVGPLPGEWPAEPRELRRAALRRLHVPVAGLDPAAVVQAAAAGAPGALATVDAGAHMLLAMPLWPGRALISSGLATMGFALPAAIGAGVADPTRRIVCLTGDGGLAMCAAELETLARLGLPVTVVVFNDAALSLIEIKQRSHGHGGAGAVRHRAVDWTAVARGFGLVAVRAETPAAVEAAVAGAARAPLLVDAPIDPSGYRAVLAATRS